MVIANRTIEALTSYQHVIILTHVPPFLEQPTSGSRWNANCAFARALLANVK